jgi:WD40 repeat protein
MYLKNHHIPSFIIICIAVISLSDSSLSQGTLPSAKDIKEEIAEKMDCNHTYIRDGAMELAKEYPGIYNINQVCEIYDRLAGGGWDYDHDINVVDRINYANETLLLAMERNVLVVGDCEDFAILMASLIESIGGSARVTFAYISDENEVLLGGHAYAEVYLGKENDISVTKLIDWLKDYYDVDEINYDITTGEVWLKLDCRYRSRNHPGESYGPYLEEDEIVRTAIVFEPDVKRSPRIIPLIDPMNSEEGWSQKSSSASSIEISPVEVRSARGIKVNALEISYDLNESGWAVISKEIGPKDLSDIRGIKFSFKGDGEPNTIELRMMYVDGTTFVASWIGETDTDDKWTSHEVLWSQFDCLEPNDTCEYYRNGLEDPNNISEVKLIISNDPSEGDVPGRGTLVIDRVQGLMVISDTIWADMDKERQKNIALDLATKSEKIRDRHLSTSVLLAVESMRRYPRLEGDLALRRGLDLLPTTIATMHHNSSVWYVAFSPDGTKIATASDDNTSRIWDAATGNELAIFEHDDRVRHVAFSPDGTKLATASFDKTARIWDTATGKELARLEHNESVRHVAFSPNGATLATASFDDTARIWGATTGEELGRLVHEGSVDYVEFSPDGSKLATVSGDGTARIWDTTTVKELARLEHNWLCRVAFSPDGTKLATTGIGGGTELRIWDAATGKELARLRRHLGTVLYVEFSPDGSKLATASIDDTARIWHTTTGLELARIELDESVDYVKFSPDGEKLATVSGDYTAQIWDALTYKELLRLEHDESVNQIAFSPDGEKIITVSGDGMVRIWDAATDEEPARLEHSKSVPDVGFSSVKYVEFSPDGAKLATASYDYTARIWDAATGKEVARLEHSDGVLNVAFSPDSTTIATASLDGTARIWDALTGKKLAKLEHEFWWVNQVVFSPDGSKLATASFDGPVRIWNVSTGIELVKLEHYGSTNKVIVTILETTIYNGTMNQIVFSPDGTTLATASSDGTARIWGTSTGRELARFEHDGLLGEVNQVAFSPDGATLATASSDETARLWNISTGKELARFEHDGSVYAVAFNPDGATIATASSDAMARIWDVSTGTEIAKLEHDDRLVDQVEFNPDGTTLATVSSDKIVRLWDAATGTELARLEHDDSVYAIDFSPDGSILATASNDCTARIWHLQPEDLICEACSRLDRNLTQEEWDQYFPGEPYRKTCDLSDFSRA